RADANFGGSRRPRHQTLRIAAEKFDGAPGGIRVPKRLAQFFRSGGVKNAGQNLLPPTGRTVPNPPPARLGLGAPESAEPDAASPDSPSPGSAPSDPGSGTVFVALSKRKFSVFSVWICEAIRSIVPSSVSFLRTVTTGSRFC